MKPIIRYAIGFVALVAPVIVPVEFYRAGVLGRTGALLLFVTLAATDSLVFHYVMPGREATPEARKRNLVLGVIASVCAVAYWYLRGSR
jgi:hypothetical protein